MDLVDDYETHELRVRAVAALARDDVPLLGRREDHLRVGDLLLRELLVARQLLHGDTVRLEALAEVEDHLLDERLR